MSPVASSGALWILALLSTGCSQPTPAESPAAEGPATAEPARRVVGGACKYVEVVGQCTVTTIADPAADDFKCEGGSKKVSFQFAPTDPSAKLEHGGPDPRSGVLTAGGGQLPSPGWLEANAVKEGAAFACTRKHIEHGTCSPVVWAFADLKLDESPCK